MIIFGMNLPIGEILIILHVLILLILFWILRKV